MDSHQLKYVVILLIWHHVLAQYAHITGHQTEYIAVLNQHEPTTKCINKMYLMDVKKSFSVGCSDLLFGECAINIYEAVGKAFYVFAPKAPKDLATFATNAKTTLNQQTLVPFESWGKVSNQAFEAYTRLMNAGLKDYIQELWAEACDRIIQFRSHSLACCVNQMLGVYLTKNKIFASTQLGFLAGGCPRCGDQDFAANVDKAFGESYRFNFKEDSIPTYPDNTCSKNTNAQAGTGTDCWFHGCQNPVIYTKYTFAGSTVNYTKCTTAEDTTCHSGTDPSWHTKYFQVQTSHWTTMSCLFGPKYVEVENGQ